MTSQSYEKDASVAVKKGQSPIQAFQKEMNGLFDSFFGETLPHVWRASEMYLPFGTSPATDVIESDTDYKITAELPGMDEKDVTIDVSEGYVTIKGKKEEDSKVEKNGYFRRERSFGEFQRVVALPAHLANMDKAEASMSKGVITITVPKKADTQSKTRKLEIKQAA